MGLTTDQRGVGFPRILGAHIDSGAFEYLVTYTITITNNGPSTANNVSARFDPSLLLTNMTCTAPAGSSCNRDGNPFFTFTPILAPGTAGFAFPSCHAPAF